MAELGWRPTVLAVGSPPPGKGGKGEDGAGGEESGWVRTRARVVGASAVSVLRWKWVL
jgi:hypothetical protein